MKTFNVTLVSRDAQDGDTQSVRAESIDDLKRLLVSRLGAVLGPAHYSIAGSDYQIGWVFGTHYATVYDVGTRRPIDINTGLVLYIFT